MDRLEPGADRKPFSRDLQGIPSRIRSVLVPEGEGRNQNPGKPPARPAEHYTVLIAGREVKAQGPHGLRPGDPVIVLKQTDGRFVLKTDTGLNTAAQGARSPAAEVTSSGFAVNHESSASAVRTGTPQFAPEKTDVSHIQSGDPRRANPVLADIVRQAFA